MLLLAALDAWTGSSGARHLPTDAAQASSRLSRALPFSLGAFMRDYYDRKMLRLNHTKTHFDPAELWRRDDFLADLRAIADDGKISKANTVKSYPPGRQKKWSVPAGTDSEEAARLIEGKMSEGHSFVLAYEHVSAARRPMRWLSDGIFELTGLPASIHLYCSAKGAQVLKPHTDPYDVLVWQLVGSKSWRACVPREEMASGSFNVTVPLSDSQRCLLQELAKDNIEGCTTYTVDDAASLDCEDFLMEPGDVLYMPKGVVHYADTHKDTETFHLTIGLHRVNMQWLDVLHYMIDAHLRKGDDGDGGEHGDDEADPAADDADAVSPADGEAEGEAGGAAAAAAPPVPAAKRAVHELLELYAESAEGVHLQEAVSGWLLRCHRPSALAAANASDTDGGGSGDAPGVASCAELWEELRRVFSLHLERFGGWLLRVARRKPWRLALETARKEARGGEPPVLDAAAGVWWWSGDASLVSTLDGDEEALQEALVRVGRVVTYENTTAPWWGKREKGGSTELRRANAPPTSGRTLCDDAAGPAGGLAGWEAECRGSDANVCEVFVDGRSGAAARNGSGASFSCAEFCGAHGLWCEASWDDRPPHRCEAAAGKPNCAAKRSSQICRCRRECGDRGPWDCFEPGCPARSVGCDILSEACDLSFGEIWNDVPLEGDIPVHAACPLACGKCVCAAPSPPPLHIVQKPPRVESKRA